MWLQIGMAAASMVSASNQKTSGDAQNSNQKLWNQYNAQMSYNVEAGNIAAQALLTQSNIAMSMVAAESSKGINRARIEYNAFQLTEAALHNDELYEEELELIWEQNELDIMLLEKARAVERGEIEADQSASGTVMGQDSNADVVISQQTNAALDVAVVKYGANLQAKRVSDARAKSLWDAGNEIANIAFEGKMFDLSTDTNAALSASGMAMESNIGLSAREMTNKYKLEAGLAGADTTALQNSFNIDQNFRSGMYNAIGSGVSSYYNMKGTSTTGVVNSGAGSSLMTSKIRTQNHQYGGR